jgi:ligand-binding SRPBCC domain-containing protein
LPVQRRLYQLFIDRPPEAVFEFHANLKNHPRINPPESREEVVSPLDTELALGVHLSFRTRYSGLWHPLESEVVEWNPPFSFVDRQVTGPFASWSHRHRFVAFQTGTLMTDQIEYTPAGGPLGNLAEWLYLGKRLDEFFHHRQAEAKRLLEQVGRIKGR